MSTENLKEQLSAIFTGADLSEETQEKLATIFEAAIIEKRNILESDYADKADSYGKYLQEQYAEKAATDAATLKESTDAYAASLHEEFETAGRGLVEQYNTLVESTRVESDAYLAESVKQWIAENEAKVISGQKMQLMESFVGGLRTLFLEHQIDIPEAEQTIVDGLQAQVTKLQESAALTAKLVTSITEERDLANKEKSFVLNTQDLSEMQKEKLQNLLEGFEETSIDAYEKRINILKESHILEEEQVPTAKVDTLVESVDDNKSIQSRGNSVVKADVLNALRGRF